MLATGRRALHHAAFGHHQRPEDGQAQQRHLPYADIRQSQRRHALAAPEAWSRALSRTDAQGRGGRRSASRHGSLGHDGPLQRRLACCGREAGRGKDGSRGRDRTEPAVMFSSIVPAPPDIEEYMIAGFLRQKPVELVKCETVDLEVPATAEIVLEGYVQLDELRMEGPFGDHTGFYTPADLYPVFHVTCVTHRKDPIYSTTIVGKPPMEDAWMGKAVERIFLPLMRLTI